MASRRSARRRTYVAMLTGGGRFKPNPGRYLRRYQPAGHHDAVRQARGQHLYEDFGELVRRAQGDAAQCGSCNSGLDRRPRPAGPPGKRRLVRLIGQHFVTVGRMTTYCLLAWLARSPSPHPGTAERRRPGWNTTPSPKSAIFIPGDAAALQVAERLDTEVLGLLPGAAGMPLGLAPPRLAGRGQRTALHDRHLLGGQPAPAAEDAGRQPARRRGGGEAKPTRNGPANAPCRATVFADVHQRSVKHEFARAGREWPLQQLALYLRHCAGEENDNPAVCNQHATRPETKRSSSSPGPASSGRRRVLSPDTPRRESRVRSPVPWAIIYLRVQGERQFTATSF